jgi:hypothetical protein
LEDTSVTPHWLTAGRVWRRQLRKLLADDIEPLAQFRLVQGALLTLHRCTKHAKLRSLQPAWLENAKRSTTAASLDALTGELIKTLTSLRPRPAGI